MSKPQFFLHLFGIGGPLADVINCADFFLIGKGLLILCGEILPIAIGTEGRR